ncbi:MAG: hypothetical protein P4L85_01635 [Paludisphaera borealis]|uniref:hypothetical protein n=1 Tax=Paludisphaera borealis TaxID=1387353 RepID=UPI002842EEEC|nr:hypothetical protein [Paludisphaera borealis]MDR3618021.1 hypothetical protein [Paludisphaera borealis]
MIRDRIGVLVWSTGVVIVGLATCRAVGQSPVGSQPQPTEPVCRRQGALHRMWHHASHAVHDRFIGDPDTFREPPLGMYVREQFAVQTAKADQHRFMLYKTDFLPGENRFSPTGASRFNLMYGRMPGWIGPITVEWTPDEPELADSRRQAVLETMARAGRPLPAERVVVGPSFYPGQMGTEAVNNQGNIISRSQGAATTYSVTPQLGLSAFGGGSQ